MSLLRDVGIRSDMTWEETFFEPWRKKFDLFLKTAFYVSKGTFWVKIFFERSLFFSNSSKLWRNDYCAGRGSFRQGYQNRKMHFSSHKINKKNQTFESSLFLSISSELWTNIYRAWRKSFGQGYQNWNLYFMSSEYHVADKNFLLKFCKFSFCSDLEHKFFGFAATEFSPGLSKLHSTCLFEFSLRCWY